MKLKNIILEDFFKFQPQAEKLQDEMRDTYNRDDIFVSMGQYSGRDRGYGKVSIKSKYELPTAEWNNIKNFLTAKGFEITQESNWYDSDDDRDWYPDIKFEFDVNEAI